MKVYENQRVADWAIRQAIQKIFGNQGRTGPWHASEIYQCLRKTILHRTQPVPYSKDAILRFAVGFAVQEWFLGPEANGEEVFGIVLSPDRVVKNNVLEFKTTRNSYHRKKDDHHFNPEDYTSWINRTRSYCAAMNIPRAHIIVFFIYASDIHAWTLEFTEEELAAVEPEITAARAVLDHHIANGTLPLVTTRSWEGECGLCPYMHDHCERDLRRAGLLSKEE